MRTADIANLNERYGIPGEAVFKEGSGSIPVLEVNNSHANASIALQGAHLMSWVPRGQDPVIWLSSAAKLCRGKSIRGGVPVCWPWFGPHASEPSYPSHGFARFVPWEVLSVDKLADGGTRLAFGLLRGDEQTAQWPYSTPLELYLTIGATLQIELVTRNLGAATVVIGDALHTYFQVGDISRVQVHGLEGCGYLDKMDHDRRKQQSVPVTITGETDRIYFDAGSDCLIDDPSLDRRIRIAKRGSHSTVVWNPWIEKSEKMGDFGTQGYQHMICVESTNAAEDVVAIPAGGEHRLWVCYSVEALT